MVRARGLSYSETAHGVGSNPVLEISLCRFERPKHLLLPLTLPPFAFLFHFQLSCGMCDHLKRTISQDLGGMAVKLGVMMTCYDSEQEEGQCDKALAGGLCNTQPKSLIGACKVIG